MVEVLLHLLHLRFLEQRIVQQLRRLLAYSLHPYSGGAGRGAPLEEPPEEAAALQK